MAANHAPQAYLTNHSIMLTYNHGTLQFCGIPLFTLIVGSVFLAALAGLFFGILRWRQRTGKTIAIGSAVVLLLFALAIMLVLITVESGSMG